MPTKQQKASLSAQDTSMAATALRIAHELEEDGDADAARRCVEYAIDAAKSAVASSADAPPADVIASIGLATLSRLAHEAGDLDHARAASNQSLSLWPGNATALCGLADIELQHGCFQKARLLYETAVTLPPDAPCAASWHATMVEEPRSAAVAAASYTLALVLHLMDRCDDAVPHLQRLGMRYRLSPAVWAAVAAAQASAPPVPLPPPPKAGQRRITYPDATSDVTRYSGAVPAPLLAQLRAAFAPSSPFFAETKEAKDARYFSFWYDVSRRPRNAVEALATHLLPLTGVADRIVGCEWWVHSKAASRFVGHQMHFDTEEGVLHAQGEVVHPAVSSVLYLSGGHQASADPTVILDQRRGDAIPASSCHVSHPAEGHVLFFPGDRLHCVCPTAPPHERLEPRERRGARQAPLVDTARQPRRVTLMIGFWARDVASVIKRAPYSACGPTPRVSRTCTWPHLLALPSDRHESAFGVGGGSPCDASAPTRCAAAPCDVPRRLAVPRVQPAWDTIPAGHQPPLNLDDVRNNQFFVRTMDDFVFEEAPEE